MLTLSLSRWVHRFPPDNKTPTPSFCCLNISRNKSDISNVSFLHRSTPRRRPTGWERVAPLTSSSSRPVLGESWRCLTATRSSQRRAPSQSGLPRAFDGYLMPTPSPALTYKCVFGQMHNAVRSVVACCWSGVAASGAVQPRVPRRGDCSAGSEGARPCPDRWRWNGWGSKSHPSSVCGLWTMGSQSKDHHHQHMVVRAVQTGECRPAANDRLYQ